MLQTKLSLTKRHFRTASKNLQAIESFTSGYSHNIVVNQCTSCNKTTIVHNGREIQITNND